VRELLRHQLGAAIATAIDFAVMIFCVSALGSAPELGTIAGASCGAVANFLLGRRWVFRPAPDSAAFQAARYALVATGSLLLNAAGEHLLAVVLGLQYVAARILVSVVVSVGWNYPLQRSFVFRAERAP